MAKILRVYWDASAWLGLIKHEPGRFDACKHWIDLAEKRNAEIVTSIFSLVEVYKMKRDDRPDEPSEKSDEPFEKFLEQDYVIRRQVDQDVAILARRLLRKHDSLRKPTDAVHLATAILTDVDELHTFDARNLLSLDGRVQTSSGANLRICMPFVLPPDPTLFPGTS